MYSNRCSIVLWWLVNNYRIYLLHQPSMTENTSLLKKSFEDKFYDFACFEQILPSSAYIIYFPLGVFSLCTLCGQMFFPITEKYTSYGTGGSLSCQQQGCPASVLLSLGLDYSLLWGTDLCIEWWVLSYPLSYKMPVAHSSWDLAKHAKLYLVDIYWTTALGIRTGDTTQVVSINYWNYWVGYVKFHWLCPARQL